MDPYTLIKVIHILSSTVLFGTGLGIAFFMFRSWFSKNLQEKKYAAQNTVLADYCFTLPAVIIQPLSGALLIHLGGYDWQEPWLLWTYALYIIAGLCWLPVIAIQIELNKIVSSCLTEDKELPRRYQTLFKVWFLLGWPAFIGLIIIFYLMVAKPA